MFGSFTKLLGACLCICMACVLNAQDTLSPYQGFTQTAGGRGGKIIRVTNLDSNGPGSLAEAVATAGPRIIVFEVAGVIDLKARSLHISEPFVTIAGQTAPSPGITLIRGGIGIQTHDVILQHLRVRTGEAGRAKRSGWEVDATASYGAAHDVIVDHCSCAWATDENLSASGERFRGDSPEQWRLGTSHKITFSNCIIAEGLSNATHSKGEHSKGSLIHDNTSDIAILGNLYANNVERNPLFKGGARGIIVNNLIVNPGKRAVHFALVADEWKPHPWVSGQLAVVGNLMVAGADTVRQLPLVMHSRGPLELYLQGNRAVTRDGSALPEYVSANSTNLCTFVQTPPRWPDGLQAHEVDVLRELVLKNAGARPWDRDTVDQRIIEQAKSGTGHVINSEQEVGGYPILKIVHESFNPKDWDLQTMERRKS